MGIVPCWWDPGGGHSHHANHLLRALCLWVQELAHRVPLGLGVVRKVPGEAGDIRRVQGLARTRRGGTVCKVGAVLAAHTVWDICVVCDKRTFS
jgi:hypothetical protein